MRLLPRFTEGEFERLVDVAVDVTVQRRLHDADFLRSFLRDRLGINDAASPAVLERSQRDSTYLTGTIRDYVARLQEQDVLNLLQGRIDDKALADRLGFDPRDRFRDQPHPRAGSSVNRRRAIVLAVTACASALMLLFPPWVEEHWRTTKSWGKVNRVELLRSQSVGHGSFRSHQSHTDVEPQEGDNDVANVVVDVLFNGILGARAHGDKPHKEPRMGRRRSTVWIADSWRLNLSSCGAGRRPAGGLEKEEPRVWVRATGCE